MSTSQTTTCKESEVHEYYKHCHSVYITDINIGHFIYYEDPMLKLSDSGNKNHICIKPTESFEIFLMNFLNIY